MTYCLDTSGLLDAWVRWYPPDVFPSFWLKIEELVDSGRIIASDEVLVELERREDDLYKWAKDRRQMFLPLDEDIQIAAGKILEQFPRLVDTRRERSQADPFVIAVAMLHKRIVITGEKPSGTPEKPRIPNVCKHFGVEYMGVVQLIRQEKWSF